MTSAERREWDGCDDVEEMLRAIARLTVVVAHRSATRRSRQSAWSGLSCEKMTRGARRRKREEKDETGSCEVIFLYLDFSLFLSSFCGNFAEFLPSVTASRRL